jgi:DNA-binding response OmpR family regulator
MIENDKIEDLKAAGANDFMHKPFEVETLIDRIGSLLDVESVTT